MSPSAPLRTFISGATPHCVLVESNKPPYTHIFYSGGFGWSKLADANFGGNWIKSYQFPPISANPGGGLRVSGENWLEIGRVEAPNSGGTTVYELYQGPFWGKLAKIGGLAPRRVSGGNWIKLRRIGRSLSNFPGGEPVLSLRPLRSVSRLNVIQM